MFKFLRSRHRSQYMSIARKYCVWPEKVYKLAHGKHSHNSKDTKILHELLSEGIIHRHSSAYGSNDHDEKIVIAKDS